MGEKYIWRQAVSLIMKKIHILVEGQTEETFVKRVFLPYFGDKLYCNPVIAKTKRVKSGLTFKGGITSYDKVKNDIMRLLQDNSACIITTMIDYYGFFSIVPYKDLIQGNTCFDRVASLENLFQKDINNPRFIPYLQLHEFEALVFVSPEEIRKVFNNRKKVNEIFEIKKQFHSTEEINNNPNTIPSKRLSDIFPSYQKTLHGPLITNRIGLNAIRKECKHFNLWMEKLENL
ncbi:MAG: DUF4276 family protein [bacterium]